MSGAEVSRRSCGAITDDAHVRSDLTHLNSRVAGEVLVVAVKIIST
jgi:multidrug resistance efflux pump